jgi:hypothetical protein
MESASIYLQVASKGIQTHPLSMIQCALSAKILMVVLM